MKKNQPLKVKNFYNYLFLFFQYKSRDLISHNLKLDLLSGCKIFLKMTF